MPSTSHISPICTTLFLMAQMYTQLWSMPHITSCTTERVTVPQYCPTMMGLPLPLMAKRRPQTKKAMHWPPLGLIPVAVTSATSEVSIVGNTAIFASNCPNLLANQLGHQAFMTGEECPPSFSFYQSYT